MKRGRLVPLDLPGAPPKRPVVSLQRLVDIPHHDRDLADGETTGRNDHLLRMLTVGVHCCLLSYKSAIGLNGEPVLSGSRSGSATTMNSQRFSSSHALARSSRFRLSE